MQKPIFEKDTDQTSVPDGYSAYLLRWWWYVVEGKFCGIGVANDAPALDNESDYRSRLPNSLGEISRIFVRNDAPIDERVFELEAKPMPATLEECHPRYPDRKNLGNNSWE